MTKEKLQNIVIREYTMADLPRLTDLWNEIVEGGISFPQEEPLTIKEAEEFFAAQSFTACAFLQNEEGKEEMVGFYILHPNNVGRCAHIANASYGVTAKYRSCGIGRLLVSHCLEMGKKLGFLGLQFNAVVSTNLGAIKLYLSLGLEIMATVKNGFRLPYGSYVDTLIFFKALQ